MGGVTKLRPAARHVMPFPSLRRPPIRRSVDPSHRTRPSEPGELPQVVAHRGASFVKAEHTLEAYTHALELGAEALECDVRLTADGHLVCIHDRRINRTSSGRGAVSTQRLADLQRLDWSSWWRPWPELDDAQRNERAENGEVRETETAEPSSVLTLEELLDTVRDWGRPVEVAIEAKHPTRYAGLVEERLVSLLDRYGWARPRRRERSPVRFMSFSLLSLRRCLHLAPALEMVYLLDRIPTMFRDGSLPLGASAAGCSIEVVRAHPEYVQKVHDHGHQVHVWTVNERPDLMLCQHLGVDAVITDDPAGAVRAFAGSPSDGRREFG